MRIEWSHEFDRWFTKLEAKADAEDSVALKTYNYIAAAFDLLAQTAECSRP